jgi:hypothetical protein
MSRTTEKIIKPVGKGVGCGGFPRSWASLNQLYSGKREDTDPAIATKRRRSGGVLLVSRCSGGLCRQNQIPLVSLQDLLSERLEFWVHSIKWKEL